MTSLRGHEAQERAFLDAMTSGRLHHGWLLTGPQGVGKRRFAEAAAARLLAGADRGARLALPDDHAAVRLVAARSHPDFRLLERDADDGETVRRNIPVDDVRGLQPLLTGTPSLGERRAIVIDAVDDLERGAANALLKSLEEPPAGTVFLLVSHMPGRLLPTIRSRVRTLRFGRLDEADMRAVIGAEAPDLAPGEVDMLVSMGAGAPGQALALSGLDLAGIDRDLHAIAAGDDRDGRLRVGLARALGPRTAQARYRVFLDHVPRLIAGIAQRRRGLALARAIAAWEEARSLAATAVPLSLDPPSTVMRLAAIVAGLAGREPAAKG